MKNKLSSVSQAIQKIMVRGKTNNALLANNKFKTDSISIGVVNDLSTREEVFRMVYEVYYSKGYTPFSESGMLTRYFDFSSETIILAAYNEFKEIIGSVSIIFNKETHLPAEKNFKSELDELYNANPRIAEISRLVIQPEYRNSKEVLFKLFNYAAIIIHKIKEYDGLVVEVNPRHQIFYKSYLAFEEIGSSRPCEQVENADGVLLYLSAAKYSKCKSAENQGKSRNLFSSFFNKAKEEEIISLIKKQIRPISAREKMYFDLNDLIGVSEDSINLLGV